MFNWLRELFLEAYRACAEIALDIYQSPVLPDFLGDFFVWLEYIFADVATAFYNIHQDWIEIIDALNSFLNWGQIVQHILSWIPNLEEIRDWFYNWWQNVTTAIIQWWHEAQIDVLNWIEEAVSGFQDLVDNLSNWLSVLQTEWDNFKETIPNLTEIINWFQDWANSVWSIILNWWDDTISEVQELINSTLVEWSPFWEGWLEWKQEIINFFEDPLQWIYSKLDEFFERFW